MNKEFDFDDIGKKMPYKTPDSFFDDNRRKIVERTCGEERKRKKNLKLLIPVTLLVAAVLAGLLFIPFVSDRDKTEENLPTSASILAVGTESSTGMETMDTFIENLSDEELQELAEQSENDIFLF